MAATYTSFYTFPQDLLIGLHDFDTDVFHIMLTNTAPDAATDLDYTDIVEITAQNGYSAGGSAITLARSLVGDVAVMGGSTLVFTASGGSFGPYRYAVLFNYSQADQRLIGFWDYGVSASTLDTETLTVVPDATNGVFRITIS